MYMRNVINGNMLYSLRNFYVSCYFMAGKYHAFYYTFLSLKSLFKKAELDENFHFHLLYIR
jgi:hypothetical protein